jgi:regulator of sirC expression with transglutaminase-like and TPR domain
MGNPASSSYQLFTEAVSRHEAEIDLGRAALLIAEPEYPGLDVDHYLRRIDTLAAKVMEAVDQGAEPPRITAALNHVLFVQEGYRGNEDEYYDPRNSFLNEVMERKLGIPISLSVLYMEIAKRAGLKILGVGFPGHFLVKYENESGETIIDPFHGGRVLSVEKLRRRLREMYGRRVAFRPEHVSTCAPHQILARMLHNLKAIYLQREDYLKAVGVVERLLILQPDAVMEIKDRGLLLLKLECFTQAEEDLQTYLRLAPKAEDAEQIHEQLIVLGKLVRQIQ